LVSEKAFVYGRLDALRDILANVDDSLTFSPGGGYYFWKDPNWASCGWTSVPATSSKTKAAIFRTTSRCVSPNG
jgi:hypothetical protein